MIQREMQQHIFSYRKLNNVKTKIFSVFTKCFAVLKKTFARCLLLITDFLSLQSNLIQSIFIYYIILLYNSYIYWKCYFAKLFITVFFKMCT